MYDIFFHGLQTSPEMSLFMGFDRVDRIQFELRKQAKELIEIEASFPQRKMFIHLFMIIVEVNLTKIFPQSFKPNGDRNFTEDMVMTGIEAESKMG